MKHNVGDIVLAGCIQGRAKIVEITNLGVHKVYYLDENDNTQGRKYGYFGDHLKPAEPSWNLGGRYTTSAFNGEEVILLSTSGIWAMVKYPKQTDNFYPFVVKTESLKKAFEVKNHQQCIEACYKAERARSLSEAVKYTNMIKEYMLNRGD